MKASDRLRQLDALLPRFHDLWHPQPFRDAHPAWIDVFPALHAALMALDDGEVARLNDDSDAALALLAVHLPEVTELRRLADLPLLAQRALTEQGSRWAWEIPGRKKSQIEAFAAAAAPCSCRVIDWCGGKGHLGRLLALSSGVPVETLEIDSVLCDEGRALAARLQLPHEFIAADALTVSNRPDAGTHAVALHACGELHRRLIVQGVAAGVSRFDVAPCCYYRGVGEHYQALSSDLALRLTRDDTRLAITETVTASPRLARQRDKEMAWKLGFVAFREQVSGDAYRSFKPVPAAWFRDTFAGFLGRMASREGLDASSAPNLAAACEQAGWLRQREVMRLSVVRHAFRRALEVWLVADLAGYLDARGYAVEIGQFCARQLTPRNVLISARCAGG